MPFEAFQNTVSERVDQLNETYRNHAVIPVLREALDDPRVGRVAMVSSFGAESVVLLHMISVINKAWITGRKRFQAGTRQTLDLFENEEDHRIKINPLAHWRAEDLQDYIINNRLPRHPLVAQGYPSIGCSPTTCTRKVAEGDDPRSGRWSGKDKTECGIHFGANGASPIRQKETET